MKRNLLLLTDDSPASFMSIKKLYLNNDVNIIGVVHDTHNRKMLDNYLYYNDIHVKLFFPIEKRDYQKNKDVEKNRNPVMVVKKDTPRLLKMLSEQYEKFTVVHIGGKCEKSLVHMLPKIKNNIELFITKYDSLGKINQLVINKSICRIIDNNVPVYLFNFKNRHKDLSTNGDSYCNHLFGYQEFSSSLMFPCLYAMDSNQFDSDYFDLDVDRFTLHGIIKTVRTLKCATKCYTYVERI